MHYPPPVALAPRRLEGSDTALSSYLPPQALLLKPIQFCIHFFLRLPNSVDTHRDLIGVEGPIRKIVQCQSHGVNL